MATGYVVIEQAHNTHSSVQATKNMAKLMSWLPGARKDVKKFMNGCSECANIRPRTEKLVNIWPDEHPSVRLHMD